MDMAKIRRRVEALEYYQTNPDKYRVELERTLAVDKMDDDPANNAMLTLGMAIQRNQLDSEEARGALEYAIREYRRVLELNEER